MKKALVIATGTLVGLVVLLGLLQTLASERIEVVELRTIDSAGDPVVTRLWIVDHEGRAWLRVGGDGSSWFSRLTANPEVTVMRGDESRRYLAVPRPDKSAVINDLMQAKYTWGDTLIGVLVGSREGSIPIELVPRNETGS